MTTPPATSAAGMTLPLLAQAAGGRGSAVAEADWTLYTDWCTATGHDPQDHDPRVLAVFLAEIPGTAAVLDRRACNVHRAQGVPPAGLPRPTTSVPQRIGPEWLNYDQTLAALRVEWWPEGIGARRDALILVLTANRLTRNKIRNLRPADVQPFPVFTVAGVELGHHPDPVLCPRCALTRWLQVLDAAKDRSRYDLEDLLTSAREQSTGRHDCLRLLEDGWQHTRWLTPAIDRHGAIDPTTPITNRGITAVLARRYRIGQAGVDDRAASARPAELSPGELKPTGTRPGPAEQDELAALYERIEHEADLVNGRIQAVLDGLA